jgi:cellulose synthase/poly-beta-1,6-N-acetylglucosamine synthase-like glycosyltransferase
VVGEAPHPLVSVLVCTSNRKANVVPTIESIRGCGYADYQLLVLDQSRDDSTEEAVRDVAGGDARIEYVRLHRPSKPRALNEGLRRARGKYILLTDDDCEVLSGWVRAVVDVFDSDIRIGCVLGDVAAGPHDPNLGYIPVCRISKEHRIFELAEFLKMPGWTNFGMGANMALRADTLSRIGGWDPCIGPGASFRSGDDHDTIARTLLAGYGVAFCPGAAVVHYGLRQWAKAGEDQGRYGFGMGAAFAKQLRCGTLYPGPLRVFGDGISKSIRSFRRGTRPLGLAFPKQWMSGFWKGLWHPLNEHTRCFVEEADDGEEGTPRVAAVLLRQEQDSNRVVLKSSERP